MMHKNTQSSRRWGAGGLRLRLFALLGLVLLAGLVLSQCRDNGVGGGGGSNTPGSGGGSRTALTGVIAITAGGFHSCARQGSQKQALCWGRGADGQLGNGAKGVADVISDGPVAVLGGAAGGTALTGVDKISAGQDHTCAVIGASTKQALCWGLGDEGQLGSGVDTTGSPPAFAGSPVAVRDTTGNAGTMLLGVITISAGGGGTPVW